MVSCPMMPLGPASAGSGEGSVFFTAARVAEAAGRAQAKGDARRCSRNSRDVVTAGECLERFRGGDPVCVNEFHGRCSTGALEEAKEEKDMANYGTCAACGKKGNRDKDDRCYRPECKKAREKVQAQPKSAGAPAEAQECRPSEEVRAQPQASPTLAREEVAALDEAAGQDHFPQAGNMVPDLPEDLDRPFTVAGIDFAPPPPPVPVLPPLLSVRNHDLIAFNRPAVKFYQLETYSHARLVLSADGQAIGVKFYSAPRDGALRLHVRQSREVVLSSREFVRRVGHLFKQKARLETTEWDGFFVARFGGEAA